MNSCGKRIVSAATLPQRAEPIHGAFRQSSPWRLILLWAGLVALLAPGNIAAQDEWPDKVVLAIGGRQSTKVTLSGEIVEYNGEVLRIRTAKGEPPKEYAARDVVDVITQQVGPHSKGLEQFQQRDYAEAAKSLREAVEAESRMWVRREILAALVRCHLMQGDYRSAAAKFVVLYRSDPKTRSFPLIPLIWGSVRIDPAFRADAQGWLLDDEEHAAIRLLGASILLDDPGLKTTAAASLKDLAANRDRRVGVLASCQLWRIRLTNRSEINLTELNSWHRRLETVPEEIRSGPHFLMGRAYVSRKEFELAAIHFLWQPLVQPDDHFLAAQATLNAADALKAIGQLNGALRLYEEITERFPQTSAAQEASGQIQELTKSN